MSKTPPLPLSDGIKPSYLHLPHDARFSGRLLLDFLCERFPFVSRADWQRRLDSGFVADSKGRALNADTPYQAGETVYYYREISRENEPRIPFDERIIHIDEHLIVVDKPHFLPVIPSGRFLRETLLTRLRLREDLQHLQPENFTPLHRLDKDTAGVMLFSHNPATRGAYQKMFQEKTVGKIYEALAPLRDDLSYPYRISSRMVRGEKFYLTQEIEGEPNAHTVVELIEARGNIGRYHLFPETGKKHQLRVHMMRLGMPLLNDALYPEPLPAGEDNYSKPLKLLAKQISFTDPLSGEQRLFASRFEL
ncbi:MAG: pseudouridine synthase [Neisseria sp.]|nr:pseudouridine synthase [Neisseria sp.]